MNPPHPLPKTGPVQSNPRLPAFIPSANTDSKSKALLLTLPLVSPGGQLPKC